MSNTSKCCVCVGCKEKGCPNNWRQCCPCHYIGSELSVCHQVTPEEDIAIKDWEEHRKTFSEPYKGTGHTIKVTPEEVKECEHEFSHPNVGNLCVKCGYLEPPKPEPKKIEPLWDLGEYPHIVDRPDSEIVEIRRKINELIDAYNNK